MLEVSELFHRFGECVAVDRLSFTVDRAVGSYGIQRADGRKAPERAGLR